MKQRILATLISLCLLVGLLPSVALAADECVSTEEQLNSAIETASETAEDPTVIVIADNFEITKAIYIPSEKHIQIDGGGHTISRSTNGENFVPNGSLMLATHAMFFIEGDTTIKQLTIDAEGDMSHHLRGVVIKNAAVDLYDCNITGAYTEASAGGGLAVVSGIANVYGGEISKNTATTGAGILADKAGTANAYNVTISNNTGLVDGGHTIYGYNNSKLNIYAGKISNNTGKNGTNSGVFYEVGGGFYTISGDLITTGNDIDVYLASGNAKYLAYDGNKTWTVPETAIALTSPLQDELTFFSRQSDADITRRTLLQGTKNYQLTENDLEHVKVYLAANGASQYTDVTNNENYIKLILDNRIEIFKKVTITYHANYEGNNNTVSQDTGYGAKTVLDSNPFQRDGYVFNGWNTQADGKGVTYYDEQELEKVTALTENIDLYAQWTECNHSAEKAYTATDAVITEKCSTCGQVFGTATISAPTGTLVYDGAAKTAMVTTDNWEGTVPSITYKNGDVSTEYAPKNAGTYTASITVGGATAEVEFTIAKASTSVDIETDKDTLTGGGTVTLTVTETGLPDGATVSVTGNNGANVVESNGTYTANLPNATATYTFTASYEGDTNHEATSDTCTVSVTQYTSPGGGSSSGSSSSSNVSGSGDDVIISASGGTVTDAQMESAVKKADEGSTITIKATSSTTVTLPVGGMEDAADNDNDVLLDLRYGEVTLAARAIAGMTDGVSSNDKIKVSVANQTSSKDETISDLLDKGAAVFNVTVEVDGVEIHSFDGTLTITLTVSNLSKISDPHVLHILNNGTKEYYTPDRISGNTITVTGIRNLSTFAVIPGSEVPQTNPFTDVRTSDYYYDAVLWAADNGVTGGTSATTFSPNVTVTRAQMVTFLWRAHGSPKATGANPFTDVSTSDYYYDAVLWAVANGVTSGTSADTFGPDAAVTRAQAVTFQWRAAGSPVVSGSSFDDVAADAYYANAVAWAVANGITSGTGGSNFSPDVVVTRAQAVTFLWKELA